MGVLALYLRTREMAVLWRGTSLMRQKPFADCSGVRVYLVFKGRRCSYVCVKGGFNFAFTSRMPVQHAPQVRMYTKRARRADATARTTTISSSPPARDKNSTNIGKTFCRSTFGARPMGSKCSTEATAA